MPRNRHRTGTGGNAPPSQGVVAGHLLRQVRERIGYTQEALAERLGYDLNTYRGWETGRRSLGQVKASSVQVIVRKLRVLGGDPDLLARIGTAVDVDVFISDVLSGTPDIPDHPLANWVSTRDWNDMLGWATTGAPDRHIVQRPRLAPADRKTFFANLRATVDRAGAGDHATLLRRQVYFLAARDDSTEGRDWLTAAERRELRRIRRTGDWTPDWVTSRSLAVARACQGDPELLRDFIDRRLAGNDRCEAANLRYWAYWVGESDGNAISDEFMASSLGGWRGTKLLGHLTDGLHGGTPYLDLSVHSLWTLLENRPHLLGDDHDLTTRLGERISALLDQPPAHLGERARRELHQLQFATRMTTAKGPR
jgi:transcriptional regulator with XRE-family HTH domain